MTLALRLSAVAVLVSTLVALSASSASAHTGFESSDPSDGSTIDSPVEVITLVFSGPAEPTGSGFEVLDGDGQLRKPSQATPADESTWVLRFDPPLANGTIGVRWMVKAPDAHPIEGSFTFTVTATAPPPAAELELSETGQATDAPEVATSPLPALSAEPGPATDLESFLDTETDSAAVAKRVGALARILTLAGTLIGVGALAFAVAVLRGDHRDIRLVLHWVRRAGVLVVAGALAELYAQAVVEAGGDWLAVMSPQDVGSTVTSSFGVAVAMRVIGGAALTKGAKFQIAHAADAPDPVLAVKSLVSVGATPPPSGRGADYYLLDAGIEPGAGEPFVHDDDKAWAPTVHSSGAVLGAVAVVAAHLFDGHTVTEGNRLVTALADVVHVIGGSVWAGGIFMLGAVLWRRHRRRVEMRALQLAVRFSIVATAALVAVGATGVVLAFIVLDSISQLWTSQWGRTLLAKLVFVACAALAGAYNHRVLIAELSRRRHDPALAHRFRVIVTAEAAALVAVIVATALLMGAAS